MPIEFKLPEGLVNKVAQNGALDGDEVWVQFVCQTGPLGQHDPEDEPDDHVRPSHAAFHGMVFRIDDAPIPPLDYGCRCAIHYVAKPDSDAAEVIQDVAPTEPTTPDDATLAWLTDNVPDWGKLRVIAENSSPGEAIGNVQAAAKAMGVSEPRAIAQMVVDVSDVGPVSGGSVTIPVGPVPAPAGNVGAIADSIVRKALAPQVEPVLEVAETPLQWAKDLPSDQKESIREFTRDRQLVKDVRAVQTGQEEKLPEARRARAEETTANMTAAFATAPPFTGLVYRGTPAVVDTPVDGTISIDSFTSSSTARKVALEFATGPTPYLLKIRLKGGGYDVHYISSLHIENEVIIDAGVRFKVVHRVVVDGVTVVELVQI